MPNVTLISDFGTRDASSGIVKGILLSRIPGINITDVSHTVPPYDIRAAAYLLQGTVAAFPPGTVHLVLVDVFYSPTPTLLLFSHAGQHILAPDNGLLPLTFPDNARKAYACFRLNGKEPFASWIGAAADVANRLQNQQPLNLEEVLTFTLSDFSDPGSDSTINCGILYIDNFGNVVTDMTKARMTELARSRPFRISFMNLVELDRISTHYTDVRKGEPLCRFNSNGYLEICIHRGNAANLFGFKAGSRLNKIKITFG